MTSYIGASLVEIGALLNICAHKLSQLHFIQLSFVSGMFEFCLCILIVVVSES